MTPRRLALVLALAQPMFAYWDGSRETMDPYAQAMKMSKQAQYDPDALQKDPDLFKKMFGQLAIEQNQARMMDETQSKHSKKDKCMACHGTVVEFEKYIVERKSQATGGLGRRDQLAVADAYDNLCHLDRYEKQDSLNPTKREENSRHYGGLAPPVFANACKQVLVDWTEDDQVEELLIQGGALDNMYKELRHKVCNNKQFGVCKRIKGEVEVRQPNHNQKSQGMSEYLQWKDVEDEKCDDPNAKKQKKKVKKEVDPITQM